MSKGPISPLPLPEGKKYHCFLTHNWAGGNHEKVSKINKALQNRGLITWFDEQRMNGLIRDQMAEGIDGSCCIVVFVTEIYEAKANSGNLQDNCYFEFNYSSSDLANYRVAAVTEPTMLNPRNWKAGRFRAELGGLLLLDMTKVDDPALFEKQVNVLFAEIYRVVNVASSALTVGPALPIPPPAVVQAPLLPSSFASASSVGKPLVSSVTTPLDSLDAVMARKLLISLGCPDNFDVLPEEVKRHLNGELLSIIDNTDDFVTDFQLAHFSRSVVKMMFKKLQSFQNNGIPEEIMNELQSQLETAITTSNSSLKEDLMETPTSTTTEEKFKGGEDERNNYIAPQAPASLQTPLQKQEPSDPILMVARDYQYQLTIPKIPVSYSACELKDHRLAVGTKGGEIYIVCIETNQQLIIKAHEKGITVLIELSDGRLVSGSRDNLIKVWNINTGTCEVALPGHKDSVKSLCDLRDGRLISGSDDKSIKVWNLLSGYCEKTLFGHSGGVSAVIRLLESNSSSNSMIATLSGYPDYTIRIWNLETGNSINIIKDAGYTIIQLLDGRIASNAGGYNKNKIMIWNHLSGNRELTIDHGEEVYCLLQLSDHRLVSGSNHFTKIWNIHNNNSNNNRDCLQILSHEGTGANYCLFQLTDNRIVSVWYGHTDYSLITIWK